MNFSVEYDYSEIELTQFYLYKSPLVLLLKQKLYDPLKGQTKMRS